MYSVSNLMGLLCVPGSLLYPITEIYIAIYTEISNYISKKDLSRSTRGKAYVVSITYKPRFRDETKLCIVLPKIMDDAQKKHQPNQVLAQVKMCNDCLNGCIHSKPAKQN